MIINQQALLGAAPIKNMLSEKVRGEHTSHGLAEAGYDIRIKQDITFWPSSDPEEPPGIVIKNNDSRIYRDGRFTLASAIEEFQMPNNLVGLVKDKSTWARQGLSVFNTVIEPGWNGFLTLELVFHGEEKVHIPAGSGIAQVIFQSVDTPVGYSGKYQGQANRPVEAIKG